MMEDRRRRGDRIAAEEHRQPRKLCAGDEAERDRLCPGQRAVKPRRGRRGIDMMLLERTRQFGRLAKGMARVERRDIGVGQFGRSEEHTSELPSLMRTSYAVFCLKKKTYNNTLR